jgi:4-hydroxythreonine-4-phosphate dehydrogenase
MNKTKSTKKPTIAITLGDPSGIGPEIILKALKITRIQKMANFLIIGEKKIMKNGSAPPDLKWEIFIFLI